MTFALGPNAAASGARLFAFDHIGSTNTEALSRARAGDRGPLWVVTTEQTAGRGRRERTWIAPRGNLAASIVEVLDIAPAAAATLGFAAGLALAYALDEISKSRRPLFQLKWPNDVLADGMKISGILLEAETVSSGLAVVVGMGTNVVAAPQGTPYPATCLRDLEIETTAEQLFAALSERWTHTRALWDNSGFAAIRELWLARAANLDQPVSVQSGSRTIEGLFETIDQNGCLVVQASDGRRHVISAGDVYFGGARSAGAA